MTWWIDPHARMDRLYRIVYVVQLIRNRLLAGAWRPQGCWKWWLWRAVDPPLRRACNALTDASWWLEKRS